MATIVLKEAERPFKLGIILLDVIELLNKYQNQVDRLWLYDRFYMPLKKLYAYELDGPTGDGDGPKRPGRGGDKSARHR